MCVYTEKKKKKKRKNSEKTGKFGDKLAIGWKKVYNKHKIPTSKKLNKIIIERLLTLQLIDKIRLIYNQSLAAYIIFFISN